MVEIANLGEAGQDLDGWTLVDISDGGLASAFPSGILDPGGAVHGYTNQLHGELDAFSFERVGAVWNNFDLDMEGLFNEACDLVLAKSYSHRCGDR